MANPDPNAEARRALRTERARQWYERTVGKPVRDNPDNRSLMSQGKQAEIDALLRRLSGAPEVGPPTAMQGRQMDRMR